MELVTVYTGLNPGAAELIRARLEAADFHPSIRNELAALSIDGYALAAGGITVQVPREEAENASELLRAEESELPDDESAR
jgi:hypothetical protein